MEKICNINIFRDDEVGYRYAVTDDVQGMSLSSGSYDALIEKVQTVAPDLLELNEGYTGPIKFVYRSERANTVRESLPEVS